MKLNHLITEVNNLYDDGLIAEYWDFARQTSKSNDPAGDILACFIARELEDTFDPDADTRAQCLLAARALSSAAISLNQIETHLRTLAEHHESFGA